MAGYKPLKISGMETGLVQEREEFILPNDAYPVLENAFVWRERIKRKQGYELLGRLRRLLTAQALGATDGAGHFTGNIRTILGLEATAEIEPKSVSITVGAQVFTDPAGNGVLVGVGGGTINYTTMAVDLQTAPVLPATPVVASFNYFPGLPVMGLRTREVNVTNNEQLIAWDQVYAYRFIAGWQEFIPTFTWTGNDSDFFWTTNYWVSPSPVNAKIFWATNFSAADPIRYTNGATWINFDPKINAAAERLRKCLTMLPFRGRLVVFNTFEDSGGGVAQFPQRIRWAAIGNPISDVSAIFPLVTNVNANAWRDDIRGQGGFLDIPTSEDIIATGFVRDNLVIYCERSTWQLRYTGRTIAPFQIERVNSELGAESTFSAVQFDTSLVGIGDKGVVECDSAQSRRIDIKIPDLVFLFDNINNGPKRVHGIRDFVQRLAYWTYPYDPDDAPSIIFPNRRLVYNYENDSWAIFTDSLTALGTFQPQNSRRWKESPYPWETQNFSWFGKPALIPDIVGGNQQGFVEYLDAQATNDVSLTITNITGNTVTATVINSKNHNLIAGQVIKISNIPAGTPFAARLNGNIFEVEPTDANNFELWVYNPATGEFDIPQLDIPPIPPLVYVGGGKIAIRDNFRIVSKKFNFLDEGQNIQMGNIDILMDETEEGAITLNIYLDYNFNDPINQLPQNIVPSTLQPDSFFNITVPTTTTGGLQGTKNWQKVYCPVRGAFITIEWTLSNAQLIGPEQESDVQIDCQIMWIRQAGRLQTGGI